METGGQVAQWHQLEGGDGAGVVSEAVAEGVPGRAECLRVGVRSEVTHVQTLPAVDRHRATGADVGSWRGVGRYLLVMARFRLLDRLRRPAEVVRDHTVFVFSGGSVRGAAQAGMLRVLLENGIVPDEIVGVSAGALNGVYLAHDPTIDQVGRLEDLWRDVAENAPIRGNLVRNVASILRGRSSFDSGDRLRALIDEHVPMEDLAEVSVPCHVGTTDAATGQVTWWTSGPVVDLLCASTAVPGVLPVVELADGTRHIDGGVVCNIPLRKAVSLAPTRLVVLDVAAKFAPAGKQTALSLMMVGVRAAAAELIRQQWLDVPTDLDVLHVELPTVDDAPDFEFGLVPELLVAGMEAAETALAERSAKG